MRNRARIDRHGILGVAPSDVAAGLIEAREHEDDGFCFQDRRCAVASAAFLMTATRPWQ